MKEQATPLFKLETKEAKRAAELHAIDGDLKASATFAQRAIEAERSGDSNAFQAFGIASITYYCRVFNKGVRTGLTETILRKCVPEGIEAHRHFVDIRNKHLNHSVNSLEYHACAVAVVEDAETRSSERRSILFGNTAFAENPQNLGMLARLCEALIKGYIDPEIERLLCIVDTQIDKMTIDQIKALSTVGFPVNLTADQLSKRRST